MNFKNFIKSEPGVPLAAPQQVELNPFRPCEADGKPARFHRWVEEDKALLRLKFYVSDDDMERINKKFHSEGLAPINSEITKISTTFALVEYEDGTVGKVEPEKIKFTDGRGEE